LVVLGTVHNVRTSPVFVTYFPGGTTEITTASLEAKLTRVGSLWSSSVVPVDGGR
jgi:hypothetical protein